MTKTEIKTYEALKFRKSFTLYRTFNIYFLDKMLAELTAKQRLLANFMGDISERCYSAGWIRNLEYALWFAVLNGEQAYGRDRITLQDIEILKLLSEETDSWIFFDEQREEIAIDLKAWKIKYQTNQ